MVTSVVLQSFDFVERWFELNHGHKRVSTSNISICHWNWNSISAHNCSKLFLLKAYIAIQGCESFTHNFNIICLSETFLGSSTTSDDDVYDNNDDDDLDISECNLVRSDHAVVLVSIKKACCLCGFSMFSFCKNVSILN